MLRMMLLLAFAVPLWAQTEAKKPADTAKKPDDKKPAEKPKGMTPTKENVPYGDHPRQVMDFYQAKSDTPTPVVFCIHGGGWNNGSKDSYRARAEKYVKAGISVIAINYRMVPEATTRKIEPPVKWPLSDAARALQFAKSKAKEWNINPDRIGATGGSAGACSSLWLAFHDDMADPKSNDPIAKQSTRLYTAAVQGAQTTLDPKVCREWMPNARYGGHAFAVEGKYSDVKQFDKFLENRENLAAWIKEYSPLSHVSKDDPEVFLEYGAKKPPVKGEAQDDPTHSALYGMILEEKVKAEHAKMVLVYPGHTHEKYKTSADYLMDVLKK
ncbi:alpha/beta hydrolase [soil metagenome]